MAAVTKDDLKRIIEEEQYRKTLDDDYDIGWPTSNRPKPPASVYEILYSTDRVIDRLVDIRKDVSSARNLDGSAPCPPLQYLMATDLNSVIDDLLEIHDQLSKRILCDRSSPNFITDRVIDRVDIRKLDVSSEVSEGVLVATDPGEMEDES